MKPPAVGAALALLAAAPSAACTSRDCTAEARPGLTVLVVDASGAPICDAIVSIVADDAVDQPDPSPTDGACAFFGAHERPGTYDVRVVVDGVEQVQQAKVDKGECHVENVQLRCTFPT